MTKIMDFYPLKFLKSFGDFPRLKIIRRTLIMAEDKFATRLAIQLQDFPTQDKEDILSKLEKEIDKFLQDDEK